MFPGGKGANQAVAAARMGADVTFVGKIGKDIFGASTREGLKKEGINTQYLFEDETVASGTAIILVDSTGENEIVVAPGANARLECLEIALASNEIENADVILMQLEIPLDAVMYAIAICMKSNKPLILNPAPAMELSDSVLKSLYLITPNETEVELLTGLKVRDQQSANTACEVLLDKGVKNVIITMGASGAFFRNSETSFLIPAPKVNAIDTTAAGDVFNGVLASALANDMVWPDAIRRACAAASISVTRRGAQASAPFAHEILSN